MMRIYLPTIFAGAMAMLANNASAATQDINALASFRVTLTLGSTQDIDFTSSDDVEFTGTPDTSVLTLATDGTLTETGVFYTVLTATGTPGEVDITGSVGEIVDITCDATATLTNGTAGTVVLSSIKISTNAGVAESACPGIAGTPVTYTLLGTSADQILVGGSIVANSGSGVSNGDYSTANGTPDPISFAVVYQ